MSVGEMEAAPVKGALRRQVPTFALIGVFGYIVDSSITSALVGGLAISPYLARIPAFAIATVINFALNRSLTFSHSKVGLWEAFVRYVMVCAAGFVVNYAVYAVCVRVAPWVGLPATSAMVPVYIAAGTGAAMFVTFFGFRFFAFKV